MSGDQTDTRRPLTPTLVTTKLIKNFPNIRKVLFCLVSLFPGDLRGFALMILLSVLPFKIFKINFKRKEYYRIIPKKSKTINKIIHSIKNSGGKYPSYPSISCQRTNDASKPLASIQDRVSQKYPFASRE